MLCPRHRINRYCLYGCKAIGHLCLYSDLIRVYKNTTGSQDIVQIRKCHTNTNANANWIHTKINKWSFSYVIYTFLLDTTVLSSIFKPSYIRNCLILNPLIKRFQCTEVLYYESWFYFYRFFYCQNVYYKAPNGTFFST